MVENAISILEDDPHLNAGVFPSGVKDHRRIHIKGAGYGSNLTMDGTVECDAAIMDGCSRDFGSVGAVPGDIVSIPLSFTYTKCFHHWHSSQKSYPDSSLNP